jgi:polyhydroxybutyrate depolymerase
MPPGSMEAMARWFPLADSKGFVVVGPAGVGGFNGWDLSGSKDFDLMKAVIDDVASKTCIDRKRVYATGFSHGGYMSHAIGCRLSDVFAAVAPHSGAGSAACRPSRAVPVFAFHGDADFIVGYSGGQSAAQGWVTRNACAPTPTAFSLGNARCEAWQGCRDGAEVKFCTIPGGGHTWFRPATDAIWEFFSQYALP